MILAPSLTPQGFVFQTFEEIFNSLAQGYRDIYGSDIDLSQNTPDGQRIGIHAKAVHDAQTALLALYNGWDVDLAQGVQLDRLSAFCGITRRPPTKSSWDVNVTALSTANLYAGYTIKDEAGQEWERVDALTIPAGVTLVTFVSKSLGAVLGLSGASLDQVTVIPNIQTLAPAGSAVVGVAEETDYELRTRRLRSLQNPSFSTLGALTTKLLDLPGVIDARVYENKTPVMDVDAEINAHSIWVVVEGGDVAKIAEVMAKQKTGGTGEMGDVIGTWVETLPNGFAFTHTMRFSRPILAPLHVRLRATSNTATPVDQDLIRQNLLAKEFRIGEEATVYQLYELAGAGLNGGTNLSAMEISKGGNSWTPEQLITFTAEKFVLSESNITFMP